MLFFQWIKDFSVADTNTNVNLEMQVVLNNAARHGEMQFCSKNNNSGLNSSKI